ECRGSWMRGRRVAVMVLDRGQMLDQEVPPPRAVGEERAPLVQRLRVDLAPLGRAPRPAAAAPATVTHRPALRLALWVGPVLHAHSQPPAGELNPFCARNNPVRTMA